MIQTHPAGLHFPQIPSSNTIPKTKKQPAEFINLNPLPTYKTESQTIPISHGSLDVLKKELPILTFNSKDINFQNKDNKNLIDSCKYLNI